MSKSRSAIAALLLILFSSFASVAFQGCATVAKREDLDRLIHAGRYSTLWTGTFYCGTRGGYHYFWHTMMSQPDTLLKIEANEIDIPNPGKYPLPQSKWISMGELSQSDGSREDQ